MHVTHPKLSLVAVAVAAFIGAGAYIEFGQKMIAPAVATTAPPTLVATGAPLARNLPDFSAIVETQGTAVVNISVAGSSKPSMGNIGPEELDGPLGEFFRHFPRRPRGDVPTHGMGSGFIISPDGTILTNAHVVADAKEVTVKLTDRREFKAKVIGYDKPSDVAVIRIEASNLPTVRIGDPQKAKVGEWVLAIGAPFGFENSATAGIISAKSRSLPDEGFVPYLQTDVAINPGNSGGPLFNQAGEVIGVNSQIYSRSGGYQGLSFAIPIDVAMKVERQLVDKGKVSRGRLGITIQEVDQALAESFGLAKPAGALVSSVDRGSAADKGGVQPGDVIIKFNGRELSASNELPPLVADTAPGSKAVVTVWRKGKAVDLTVNVGEFKTELAKVDQESASQGRLGLAVRPLTPDEKSQADVANGLLVEDASGPAARAGIAPGDVVLSVNGEAINSVEQLRGVVAKGGKRLALLVLRGDRRIFVPVNMG